MPGRRALAAAALLALAPRAPAFTTTTIETRTPIGANRTINATEVWAVEGGGCLDVVRGTAQCFKSASQSDTDFI